MGSPKLRLVVSSPTYGAEVITLEYTTYGFIYSRRLIISIKNLALSPCTATSASADPSLVARC